MKIIFLLICFDTGGAGSNPGAAFLFFDGVYFDKINTIKGYQHVVGFAQYFIKNITSTPPDISIKQSSRLTFESLL